MLGMGPTELVIIGVLAILLFGKRLPEVAQKLGKSYREFRRGMSDLQSQVDFTSTFDSAPARPAPKRTYSDYDDYDDVAAPKFQPPPAAPQPDSGTEAA